jgi:hypothetical protein
MGCSKDSLLLGLCNPNVQESLAVDLALNQLKPVNT